jgi:hypothetical protein
MRGSGAARLTVALTDAATLGHRRSPAVLRRRRGMCHQKKIQYAKTLVLNRARTSVVANIEGRFLLLTMRADRLITGWSDPRELSTPLIVPKAIPCKITAFGGTLPANAVFRSCI